MHVERHSVSPGWLLFTVNKNDGSALGGGFLFVHRTI